MSNIKNVHLSKSYAAETLERIKAKTVVDEKTGCHVWQGATGGGDGKSEKCLYPSMHYQQRTARVTRVIYTLAYGEIPKGHDICHHCDNPLCVNIKHLFPGTRKRNMRDAMAKGRFKYPEIKHGSDHHNAKLTDDQVIEMRKSFAAGSTRKELAEKYGVAVATVKGVISGRTYSGLPLFKREDVNMNSNFKTNNPRKRG